MTSETTLDSLPISAGIRELVSLDQGIYHYVNCLKMSIAVSVERRLRWACIETIFGAVSINTWTIGIPHSQLKRAVRQP